MNDLATMRRKVTVISLWRNYIRYIFTKEGRGKGTKSVLPPHFSSRWQLLLYQSQKLLTRWKKVQNILPRKKCKNLAWPSRSFVKICFQFIIKMLDFKKLPHFWLITDFGPMSSEFWLLIWYLSTVHLIYITVTLDLEYDFPCSTLRLDKNWTNNSLFCIRKRWA